MAHPVVVHPLRVLGIAHKTGDVHLPINLKFVSNDSDDRNPTASPVLFFQDFVAIGFAPLNLFAVSLTRLDRLHAHHLHLLVLGCAFEISHVAGVQIQRFFFDFVIEILSNPNGFLSNPHRKRLVANTLVHDAGNWLRVRVHAFVLGLGHVFGDKAPLRICTAGVLNHRVHVD